jgi:ACT domain-containing protein
MLQHEKMNTNVIVDLIKSFKLTFSCYFLFSDFIAPFDLLNESEIIIFDVAFFKNDGNYLMLGGLLTLEFFLTFGVIISSSQVSIV